MKIDIDSIIETPEGPFTGSDCRVKADGVDVPWCVAVDTDRMVITCVKVLPNQEVELDANGDVVEEERLVSNLVLSCSNEHGKTAELRFP